MRSRCAFAAFAASAFTFVFAASSSAAQPATVAAPPPVAAVADPVAPAAVAESLATEPAATAPAVESSPATVPPANANPVVPAAATGAGAGPSAGFGSGPTDPAADTTADAMIRLGLARPQRLWAITAGLETHVVLVQTDPNDGRSRPDKLYNWFFVRPTLYPSKYDQIRVEAGLNEHFTADQGESGLRLTDFSARYTRSIPIKTEAGIAPNVPPMKGVLLEAEAAVTAPTSFRSQNRGIITVPRVRAFLSKAFLDRSLFVNVNGFGEYYVVQYQTAKGGNPNPLSRAAVQLAVDYQMPFHNPLSVGVVFDTSYIWYRSFDLTPPVSYGATPQSDNQATKQVYGAEAHINYSLPNIGDLNTWLAVAYATGDNTVLHDGVQHLYFTYYRRASEVYASLTARY